MTGGKRPGGGKVRWESAGGGGGDAGGGGPPRPVRIMSGCAAIP